MILPGSTIGIIGHGQLGRMLAQTAARMGYLTRVLGDTTQGCAFDVANETHTGRYDDHEVIRAFVDGIDVVTLEFENIPPRTCAIVHEVSGGRLQLFPGRKALEVAQDRRQEKQMAQSMGISLPQVWVIERAQDLAKVTTYPVILKTARGGYDGKGQVRANNRAELDTAWEHLNRVSCVAESLIDFVAEFSVITGRWADGTKRTYRPFMNIHTDGILDQTYWPPADLPAAAEKEAVHTTELIADHLGVVGLLAVEWFLTRDSMIIFNEIAPRPHNSGHLTMDCARTCQFETHLRAICGLPPRSTEHIVPGRMLNMIGNTRLLDTYVRDPNAKIHVYNKGAPRQGRKMGHINLMVNCDIVR